MGYSYSVAFKSLKELNKVEKFYNDNIDIIKKISIAECNKEKVYTLLHGKDISYAPRKKYLLGFNVGSGYPYYLILLSIWLASKANLEKLCIYYDHEKINVLTDANKLGVCVNQKGLPTKKDLLNLGYKYLLSQLYFLETEKEVDECLEKFELLFIELNERWEKI